jgi:hypothetical protein
MRHSEDSESELQTGIVIAVTRVDLVAFKSMSKAKVRMRNDKIESSRNWLRASSTA